MNIQIVVAVVIVLFSAPSFADCRKSSRDDLMAKYTEKTGEILSPAEYERKVSESISAQYVQELAVSTCEMMQIKKTSLSEQYRSLCVGVSSPYRLQCVRQWIQEHRITNSAELVLILTLVPQAGLEDQKGDARVDEEINRIS